VMAGVEAEVGRAGEEGAVKWPSGEQWNAAKKELGWRKVPCSSPGCEAVTKGWSSRTVCALCLGVVCSPCRRPAFTPKGEPAPASDSVCGRCYRVATAALLDARSTQEREVLLLHPDEERLAEAAFDVLSRSFFDDPVEHWLFYASHAPDERAYFASLRGWFRVFGNLAYGPRVPATHPPACALMYDRSRLEEGAGPASMGHAPASLVGATFWCPPSASHSVVSTLRAGMARVLLGAGVGATRRLLKLAPLTEINEELMEGKPHWYLACIGIVPEAQSMGYGSQLLQAGLKVTDASGEDCYLESSKEKNLPFYEKNGFVVKRRFQAGDYGPVVFCMVRKAGGGASATAPAAVAAEAEAADVAVAGEPLVPEEADLREPGDEDASVTAPAEQAEVSE